MARAIPVLPLVGTTTTERPGLTSPASSAASIIATPIRSLTEPPGLKYSSLAQTCPGSPSARRSRRTSGVPPTTADASAPTLIRLTYSALFASAHFKPDPAATWVDAVGGSGEHCSAHCSG